MQARLNFFHHGREAMQAMAGLETRIAQSGLEPALLELVRLRASQINGCAYCVDMHTKEARKDGLSEQWIALVCVWREALVFDARERALLAWTEAVTRLGETGAPDDLYHEMLAQFSPKDTVNLTLAIATINVWNRMAVAFHTPHPLDDAG